MDFDVKKQAKTHFESILEVMEKLLKEKEFFDYEDLKALYLKLKKQEKHQHCLMSMPIIGKMIYNKSVQSSMDSKNILKIVSIMKRCRLSRVDHDFYMFLKENKDVFYKLYFQEAYEGEASFLNQQNNAHDCLFNEQR